MMESIQFAPIRATLSGQRWGNYQLLTRLGQGASAEVFLGKHLYLDRDVAIKIPFDQYSKAEKLLFMQEARLAAHLLHPSIVRILDYGVEGDKPYLVMDYAPEGTLRQFKKMALPSDLVVTYAMQIASGLDYLHAQQIIHGDIKPANLLIGHQEQILIADFGIAQVLGAASAEKQTTIRGTPAYMAPEQILGYPCFASDQYALAVVLYELLCGMPPFHPHDKEIMQQHLSSEPPPLREREPTISPAIEQVMMRALDKDPQRRYASTGQFAQELQQAARLAPHVLVLQSQPVSAPTATTEKRSRHAKQRQRSRGRTFSTATRLGFLLATSLIWLLTWLGYSWPQITVVLLALWLPACLLILARHKRQLLLLLVCGIFSLALLVGSLAHCLSICITATSISLVLGMIEGIVLRHAPQKDN